MWLVTVSQLENSDTPVHYSKECLWKWNSQCNLIYLDMIWCNNVTFQPFASRSDDAMSHFGAFVPQIGAFDARICGIWEGNTSEALGGYLQTIEFDTDCINAKITVMGQTLIIEYRNVSKHIETVEVLEIYRNSKVTDCKILSAFARSYSVI